MLFIRARRVAPVMGLQIDLVGEIQDNSENLAPPGSVSLAA